MGKRRQTRQAAKHKQATDSWVVHQLRHPWGLVWKLGRWILVPVALVLGVNEWVVRADARAARRGSDEWREVNEEIAQVMAEHGGREGEGWVLVQNAIRKLRTGQRVAVDAFEHELSSGSARTNTQWSNVDTSETWKVGVSRSIYPQEAALYALQDEYLVRLLRVVRQQERYLEDLDTLRTTTSTFRPLEDDTLGYLLGTRDNPLGAADLGFLLHERLGNAWLARSEGDDAGFFRALEHARAIVRTIAGSARLSDVLSAQQMARDWHDALRGAMRDGASAGTIDERWIGLIEGIMERQPVRGDPLLALECERIIMHGRVAFVFADVTSTRWSPVIGGERLRRIESRRQDYGYDAPPQWNDRIGERISGYQRNIDAIDRVFDSWERQWESSRGFGGVVQRELPYVARNVLHDTLRGIGADLHLAAEAEATTRLMLLIERHRLRTGEYPASLDEVAGAAELIDVWRRGTIPSDVLYRRRVGDDGTGYVLYRPGPDGEDNGGTPSTNYDPNFPNPGEDIILSTTTARRIPDGAAPQAPAQQPTPNE